jgi:ectoine hydroxylase-related dioxygenase (phytanoyl-CoA dioxygenase family)
MQFKLFTDSRALLQQPYALRQRLEEEGYLFISGLLPLSDVHPVYEAIMRICREEGWADEQDLALGEPRLEGHAGWWAVYDRVQCLEEFHALAHHPYILQVIEAIVQERVLVHPRKIARITFPDTAHYTTPPHQDYPLIQGTPDTYTVWIPLSDCPIKLGGLAILPKSHKVGLLPVHRASGPGGLSVDTTRLEATWLAQDMRAGDALIFHSYTVHRALVNISQRRLRVSVDYRYQGVSKPVVEDSLRPHYERLTWEQIYRGWKRKDLQYYWQQFSLIVVPRDFRIMEPEEYRQEPFGE